jgi:chaperonin GroEL (HSP60 family)
MIDSKVQRLDKDRINLYLKKIENKKPIYNCILQIKSENNKW